MIYQVMQIQICPFVHHRFKIEHLNNEIWSSYEESEDGFLSIIREIDFSIPFELLLQFLGGSDIILGEEGL
ncbi:hypothetical protein GIB67_030504 [Kingdonia uniflora]|uniref:Uncharacterized protein n=1 Tax=Kingdonia uniflora TaxID=39325 RepID=A0A7J7MCQ4_9MAGN|nr:hypothetical protein GIB67_030504 [Kingdonia uniflora]